MNGSLAIAGSCFHATGYSKGGCLRAISDLELAVEQNRRSLDHRGQDHVLGFTSGGWLCGDRILEVGVVQTADLSMARSGLLDAGMGFGVSDSLMSNDSKAVKADAGMHWVRGRDFENET